MRRSMYPDQHAIVSCGRMPFRSVCLKRSPQPAQAQHAGGAASIRSPPRLAFPGRNGGGAGRLAKSPRFSSASPAYMLACSRTASRRTKRSQFHILELLCTPPLPQTHSHSCGHVHAFAGTGGTTVPSIRCGSGRRCLPSASPWCSWTCPATGTRRASGPTSRGTLTGWTTYSRYMKPQTSSSKSVGRGAATAYMDRCSPWVGRSTPSSNRAGCVYSNRLRLGVLSHWVDDILHSRASSLESVDCECSNRGLAPGLGALLRLLVCTSHLARLSAPRR